MNSKEVKWISATIEQEEMTSSIYAPRLLFNPAPILRRIFECKEKTTARIYATAIGYYQLYFNKKKLGNSFLEPAYSNYDKRVYYNTYEVTLPQGQNCIGAILGQGWAKNKPVLLLQLEILIEDDWKTLIVSDQDWQWTYGPILKHSIYHGEVYDACKQVDWFDHSLWEPVEIIHYPPVVLSTTTMPSIETVEILAPQQIKPFPPYTLVYDFGQNFSGWCFLRVLGIRGTKITIKHAELLDSQGMIDSDNLGNAKATEEYTLSGKGIEEYRPHFTYHGFRYAQVEVVPGEQSFALESKKGAWDFVFENVLAISLIAEVVHTAFKVKGSFSCSNELLNKIHKNCLWTFRSNFHSYPSDCPQRDERWGWLADAHLTSEMALYNFHIESCYNKFLQDIEDTQGENGHIPDYVPQGWGNGPGDPWWSIAYPMILWNVYCHNGDIAILKQHYPKIKLYLQSLQKETPDFLLERRNYGDWLPIERTPGNIVAPLAYLLTARFVSKIARILEKIEDALNFEVLQEHIIAAYNKKFFNPELQQYGTGTQTAQVLPLYLQIVPPASHQKVLKCLIDNITQNHYMHLSTGYIGARYLFETLVREGYSELAYALVAQKTFPGWGYMVEQGATTIWECWRGDQHQFSRNHPPLSFISGWFYSTLAGIMPDEEQPGWQHFWIKPQIVKNLSWVKATVKTVRGTVFIHWEKLIDKLKITTIIPDTSYASIFLPIRDNTEIYEGKELLYKQKQFFGHKQITFEKIVENCVCFKISSGKYDFVLYTNC